MADTVLGDFTIGRFGASAGEIRTPSGGSSVSAAADRIVIHAVDAPLFGRRKLPLKVAPGASRIRSPGTARSMAACRLPPAATYRSAARAVAWRHCRHCDPRRHTRPHATPRHHESLVLVVKERNQGVESVGSASRRSEAQSWCRRLDRDHSCNRGAGSSVTRGLRGAAITGFSARITNAYRAHPYSHTDTCSAVLRGASCRRAGGRRRGSVASC